MKKYGIRILCLSSLLVLLLDTWVIIYGGAALDEQLLLSEYITNISSFDTAILILHVIIFVLSLWLVIKSKKTS